MRFLFRTSAARVAIATVAAVYITTGCVPVLIGGGMAGGGYIAVRDKGVGETITDAKLDTLVKSRLYKANRKLFSEVSAVASDGIVLLTGVVSNQDWVMIAEKETWAVKGVKGVRNYLRYGDELTPGQITKDGWITTKCKTTLTVTKDVRSVNYKIKTADSVVYVAGIAQTVQERSIVLATIKQISGVKRVVSFIKIADSKAQPT
ncbi:MAG: BON domain-containing protein [Holosporales bacterium]|jgi:osmotically-inducible protein OsmY|nr:BON domain-containing protein [Holosporales bacterium]